MNATVRFLVDWANTSGKVFAAGSTFTDTKIITVGRRDVTAFAEKGRMRLNFSGKRSDLDLTMIADDPVRDANDPATSKGFIFPRTRQQAREAMVITKNRKLNSRKLCGST